MVKPKSMDSVCFLSRTILDFGNLYTLNNIYRDLLRSMLSISGYLGCTGRPRIDPA